MATTVQQPYNLFATPKLKKPVQAYDPTKSVQDNMNGSGAPSAQNIVSAYQTPQAQLQQAQAQKQTQNQQQKQQFNGDPNSSTAGMDYLNSLYTPPEQEEKLRKASVMNQRILAIGDAIRHIGNIANTVNYAPAQQFNSPVAEEQARYEKGKALRDRANQQFYSYQQQKAAQDAAQRKWEQQFQLNAANAASQHAYRQEQARIAAERAANQKAYQEGTLTLRGKLGEAQQKERERHNRVAERQGQQRIGIASRNATNMENYRQWKMKGGGGGSRSNPYTFPTKNGYINLGRDLNTNQIGKKALFSEMKKAGIIDDVWQRRYENMYDAQQQSALLNTAISQWLMTNDNAEEYMKKHFGASSVGGGMDLGLEDDEDEMDLGLD